MSTEIVNASRDKMDKSLKALQNDLGKLRTGRASLSMLDGLKVTYYGTSTPLNQVATLSVPEPRMIVIQPWEASLIPEIETAIQNANLGIHPNNDGKVVRLPIPKLTEERRKEIVKQVKNIGEEAKVAVRHVRRDANEQLKKLKDSGLSEDDVKRLETQVQKITDEHITKIDEVLSKKEQDIMTV